MAKRALITGASSGLGLAFARLLAGERYDLVLVARDELRLKAAQLELTAQGVQVDTIAGDLSTPTGLGAVEARLLQDDEPIDFLVNNAGFGIKGKFVEADIDEHEKMIDVNVTAVVRLTHAALVQMTKRNTGDIINVSSVAGYTPSLRPSSTYAATKAFVAAFSQGLASMVRKDGITLSAVAPGFVRTEFHERAGMHMSRLPGFMWTEADFVACEALKDHRRGKVISVPGWPYKVFMSFIRVLPSRTQHFIAKMITRHQH